MQAHTSDLLVHFFEFHLLSSMPHGQVDEACSNLMCTTYVKGGRKVGRERGREGREVGGRGGRERGGGREVGGRGGREKGREKGEEGERGKERGRERGRVRRGSREEDNSLQ